jgi:hypothetical protein
MSTSAPDGAWDLAHMSGTAWRVATHVVRLLTDYSVMGGRPTLPDPPPRAPIRRILRPLSWVLRLIRELTFEAILIWFYSGGNKIC